MATYRSGDTTPPAEYQIINSHPNQDQLDTEGVAPFKMDADSVLHKLGSYGRFQVLVFLSLAFVYMRGSWPVLAPIFLAGDPGHHCKVPLNSSLNMSLVVEDGEWSKCSMYVPGSDQNKTQGCTDGWHYDTQFDSTILTEWDLVCDDSYLAELSTTIYMIGNTIGALCLTSLSDRFGRKKLILFMLWIQAVIGVGTAFANSYILFTVLRFFIGLLNMPIALTTYVMMTEVFPSTYRALPSVGVNCFWGIGLIFLSIFGYFVRDWRNLQLLISLPNLLTLVYYFFLPESIPWLVAKERYKEAETVAKTAAKINGITLPEALFTQSTKEDKEEENQQYPGQSGEGLVHVDSKKYTIFDLFKTPKLRKYTLILFYLWSANSLSYFGIMFSTPTLHGNLFLNLGISGAVEIPALFICMWAMQVFGRRKPHMFFLLLCGVMNITTIFVPQKTESGTDLSALIIFLAMVGKFGITASYSVAYLYSSEVFPTVLRNHAVGLASFFENIGGIAAPFIVYASTNNTIEKLPLVIFGVITLVAGVLCFFLPETHKCPLPETIEDVEKLSRKTGPNEKTAINEKSEEEFSTQM